MARQGNRPDRRIAPIARLDEAGREALLDALTYVGSAHHKRTPGDYGFQPPTNPRPAKSLCDGHRIILKAEAQQLLVDGVRKGMFSEFSDGTRPKYIWCVDGDGRTYEAKSDRDGYHGYVLGEDDDMRDVVLKEWKKR